VLLDNYNEHSAESRTFVSPWQPQDVRLLCWENDLCSYNN